LNRTTEITNEIFTIWEDGKTATRVKDDAEGFHVGRVDKVLKSTKRGIISYWKRARGAGELICYRLEDTVEVMGHGGGIFEV
jgi:hypothetical protein